MAIDETLPIQLIASFQMGGIQFPDGRTALDLFATVKTNATDPGRTIRLRLMPPMHDDMILALQEAQVEKLGDDHVQRLFDHAELGRVTMDETGATGFVLSMAQNNASGNHALPVRMFLTDSQLMGLSDLLGEAVAHYGLRPPIGPATRQ
jgi:hypothetical protein